jgi:uracil-DNA glycosylase
LDKVNHLLFAKFAKKCNNSFSDPYHGPNQAHGLCFSVKKNVPPPPSLKNIYKELKNDIEDFTIPKHGTLIGWATQGLHVFKVI